MSWPRGSQEHCSPGYRFRHCICMYVCNFYGMCIKKKLVGRPDVAHVPEFKSPLPCRIEFVTINVKLFILFTISKISNSLSSE